MSDYWKRNLQSERDTEQLGATPNIIVTVAMIAIFIAGVWWAFNIPDYVGIGYPIQ